MSDHIPDKMVLALTNYYELVRRRRSTFLMVNGLWGSPLSDAEDREILNEVCERLRVDCRLSDDQHQYFKRFAFAAFFGEKKKMWTVKK